ncbi:MAG: thioesterase family protein [Pseudomonadota bacterium]|nr:thioesterase family protein [Pseudomonadota bacterium]
MKTQPWQLETGAYPFSIRFNPHYSHLDTERHVNNVAVQSFHTEARTRFHMAVLGDRAWYSDDVLLRPRRTVTHFLRETHYPHEVTAAVRLVAVEDDSYRLVQALFQSGECVGVQECLMGAWGEAGWAASRWVALPEAARRALAAEQVDGQPLLPWPELPEETETLEPGPRQVALTARYADLDPDRRLSELAQARYLEQARAGSVTMLRQPNLGLLVARIDIRYQRWDTGMGEVALSSELAGIGNSSFVLRGRAAVDGRPVAMAESVMVLIDRDTHRPTPVPDALRAEMAVLQPPTA